LCKRECIYVIIFQTEQQTLIRKENELYARQHDIIPHKYFLTPIKHTYTIPTFPNSGTSSQKKKKQWYMGYSSENQQNKQQLAH